MSDVKKEVIDELDKRYVKKPTKVEMLEDEVKELKRKLAKGEGDEAEEGGEEDLFDF